MAEDFNINIDSDLDISDAEKKLNDFLNEKRKLKVSLDLEKSADAQAKDLMKFSFLQTES